MHLKTFLKIFVKYFLNDFQKKKKRIENRFTFDTIERRGKLFL